MDLTCKHCGSLFRAAVHLPLVAAVRVACPACAAQMTLKPASSAAVLPEKFQPAATAAPSRPAPEAPHQRPDVERRFPQPPALRRSAETPHAEASVASMRRRRVAIVADEARPFRSFIAGELARAGFDVTTVDDGDEALDLVQRSHADLAIVNVYLKGRLGVEVTEAIKANPTLSTTHVILIGALFRANRFRANPTNLYGADEYIEEQIPEREFQQIIAKLFPEGTGAAPEEAPAEAPKAEPREYEEARRLARLILSDIVIYHAAKADRGIADDNFFELLKDEIDEGRHYYESRVPVRVRHETEIFTETIQQFVEMKREELERLRSGARANER